MITANHQAGRIVEAHTRGVVTYAEFMAFRSAFQERLARALSGASKAVVVGDLRQTDELTPDVAPVVLGMLRADNARVERAAHLVTAGSAFARQYEQLVGGSNNPNRQVFATAEALQAWLAPVLTEAEKARLQELLR